MHWQRPSYQLGPGVTENGDTRICFARTGLVGVSGVYIRIPTHTHAERGSGRSQELGRQFTSGVGETG